MTHHQPRTGELIQHIFCLHTTQVEGPIMLKGCIGQCVELRQCSSTCLEIEKRILYFWGGGWGVRSMHNEHIPCHCLVRIPLSSPMRKYVVSFKKNNKYFIRGMCAWMCVWVRACVYINIYINIYMVCYIWCSSFQKNITCKQKRHCCFFFRWILYLQKALNKNG